MTVIIIGYVPLDWKGDVDQYDRIFIGNTEDSNTLEIQVQRGVRSGNAGPGNVRFSQKKFDSLKNYSSEATAMLARIVRDQLGVSISARQLSKCIRVVLGDYRGLFGSKSIEYITGKGDIISDAKEYVGSLYFNAFDTEEDGDNVIAWHGRRN